MNVYHQCASGHGKGQMTLTPITGKKVRYQPTIADMNRKMPSDPPPVCVKYWQPYHCRECGFTAYELCE